VTNVSAVATFLVQMIWRRDDSVSFRLATKEMVDLFGGKSKILYVLLRFILKDECTGFYD